MSEQRGSSPAPVGDEREEAVAKAIYESFHRGRANVVRWEQVSSEFNKRGKWLSVARAALAAIEETGDREQWVCTGWDGQEPTYERVEATAEPSGVTTDSEPDREVGADENCVHDSTRVDGVLNDCCLRCGANGYWLEGREFARVSVHPGGKVLIQPIRAATNQTQEAISLEKAFRAGKRTENQ